MSRIRSDASPTPTKYRSGIVRAFSSFSKPVEEWGVSSVPVLSTSVTPRRGRTLTNPLRQNSDSSNSASFTLGRPSLTESLECPSRMPPIRPLSIATVSTFGDWLSERIGEDNEAREDTALEDTALEERGTTIQGLSIPPSHQHGQLYLSTRPRTAFFESKSTSSVETLHRGFAAAIHPLRMHPYSPSTPLPGGVKVTKDPNAQMASRRSKENMFTSSRITNDKACEASRNSISSLPTRRELPKLNVEATKLDSASSDEGLKYNDQDRSITAESNEVSTSRYSSLPGDVGYVEAMRLWYEEKENGTLEAGKCGRKAAERPRTAVYTSTNVITNQRH